MGRITGSASIETLVRVGIEKEHGLSPDSKMVVLHDFTPCVDDELEVKRGQIVNILYRENDWVYVIGQDTRQEGFIPHSYCAPYNTQLAELAIKKKLPREIDQILLAGSGGGGGSVAGVNNIIGGTLASDLIDGVGDTSGEMMIDDSISALIGLQQSLKHSQGSLSSEPDFLPFAKDPSGRYIVLYTFIARDENDVSVERGEFVTVLNREDPEWFWIVRSDAQEGFIPSGFVYPADNVLQGNSKSSIGTLPANTLSTTNNVINNNTAIISPNLVTSNAPTASNNGVGHGGNSMSNNGQQQVQLGGTDDLRYHGTELVMLYDYKVKYLVYFQ